MIQKHGLVIGEQPHPAGRVLSVGNQRERLVCWADSDGDGGVEVVVQMTGQDAPGGSRFVGTVLLEGGAFVAHVFVLGETP